MCKIKISEIVMRNDRKYSLISPFWLDIILDSWVWVIEVDFVIVFSSQIRSSRFKDNL